MPHRQRPPRRTPARVTLARLTAAAASFGYHFYAERDRLLIPFPDHRTLAYLTSPGGTPMLVLASQTRADLPLEAATDLAAEIDAWNRTRIGPSLYFRHNGDGSLAVHGRAAVPVAAGLTDEQLTEAVGLELTAAQLAVDTLAARFPALRATGTNTGADSDEATAFDFDAVALAGPLPGGTEDPPYLLATPGGTVAPRETSPVTPARLLELLAAEGVPATWAGPDVVAAWVGATLVGLALEEGPHLLITAHWGPGPGVEEELRARLVCNDWTAVSALARAFTSRAETGLEVRTEFALAVTAGLNPAQLHGAVTGGIAAVLRAAHTVSTELGGVGALRRRGPGF
ncbi:YbjN domain-containing protein [Corynebacterium frankenforstense]|uniref:YbjN domain-containing protein n=1 Tax=Corynebacterium frankenforstense TaxID=1230998 RepID=UPI002550DA09|nr:YbjN domain-containing protein [Corynebacterium frankenforstense]MDK6259108.1 YbjN domain-containing protein [Corynebacterium frankenforstense]